MNKELYNKILNTFDGAYFKNKKTPNLLEIPHFINKNGNSIQLDIFSMEYDYYIYYLCNRETEGEYYIFIFDVKRLQKNFFKIENALKVTGTSLLNKLNRIESINLLIN